MLIELSIKFFMLPAKYHRKSHVKVGKDLYVQIPGAKLERRGHLQWPFPTQGSPRFSKQPGHVHALLTSIQRQTRSSMCCGRGLHCTPSSVSSAWWCRRPGHPMDQLSRGTSPPQCHLYHERQHAVPEGGKLSCWLFSTHHKEGKIM